jgi:DNA (cytosine-5)-methyltransferase 1
MNTSERFSFYEFFAGGGMARLGLGPNWQCLFSNDNDSTKADSYRANFDADEFSSSDIHDLAPSDLPGQADLAWASFPCQDLSLAGTGAGLKSERSGTFFEFWRLMQALHDENRQPDVLVIENVSGLVTSKRGANFQALLSALADGGYHFGAVEIDAARFVPQSRPRVFVIAVKDTKNLPSSVLRDSGPLSIPSPFHPPAIRAAADALPPELAARWVWFKLPQPPERTSQLADILENAPTDVEWHRPQQTHRLLELMNETHRARVAEAEASDAARVGAVYRRMRSENGKKRQRAEIRFDGLSGCLRTPIGGSSRQFLLFVKRNDILSRPISPRETARLMGLPEDYRLPLATTAALKLTGDGVAVPAVRWLSKHLLEPLFECAR